MARATEVLFQGDGVALGLFGPVVIAITDGPTAFSPANVRRVVDEVARLRRTTHAKQLVYFYVAGGTSELPGAEARAISAHLGELFDACVGVHEGAGFRASAVRGVVVGISMLSRARVRPDVVATVAEGAARVVAKFPQVGTEAEVRHAVETIRSAAHAE